MLLNDTWDVSFSSTDTACPVPSSAPSGFCGEEAPPAPAPAPVTCRIEPGTIGKETPVNVVVCSDGTRTVLDPVRGREHN